MAGPGAPPPWTAGGTALPGATTDGQWHGPFQLLELIAERIADAALQQAGDILIELAVLAP
ncbi:MAG: hypothetical protein KGO22_21730 [Gammaproteobacteria bacterium]|nr:hypothetical protein [Gammaproteobacteria bacterium]